MMASPGPTVTSSSPIHITPSPAMKLPYLYLYRQASSFAEESAACYYALPFMQPGSLYDVLGIVLLPFHAEFS